MPTDVLNECTYIHKYMYIPGMIQVIDNKVGSTLAVLDGGQIQTLPKHYECRINRTCVSSIQTRQLSAIQICNMSLHYCRPH